MDNVAALGVHQTHLVLYIGLLGGIASLGLGDEVVLSAGLRYFKRFHGAASHLAFHQELVAGQLVVGEIGCAGIHLFAVGRGGVL